MFGHRGENRTTTDDSWNGSYTTLQMFKNRSLSFDTMTVISGQNGRNDLTHTKTRLIGTRRTDMRDECQLTLPPSPLSFEVSSPVCCANSGGAARGCERTAVPPTKVLVTHSESRFVTVKPTETCVTHHPLLSLLKDNLRLYFLFVHGGWNKVQYLA